jgi:hypothetical protein
MIDLSFPQGNKFFKIYPKKKDGKSSKWFPVESKITKDRAGFPVLSFKTPGQDETGYVQDPGSS